MLATGLVAAGAAALSAASEPEARGALAPFLAPVPVVAEHHYRMAGRVRPLMFWFGKDDVGGASIVWRNDGAGGRAFELLIGSDPARAPRRLNRWGYIAERVGPSDATLLGVMKESKEDTLADATANVDREAGGGTFTYKAIHSAVGGGRADAAISTVQVDTDFTYHDVASLLRLVQTSATSRPPKSAQLAPGTRSGFLVAVAEVVHRTVLAQSAPGSGSQAPISLAYIYNGKMYDLRLRKAAFRRSFELAGRTYVNVIQSEFEVHNRASGKESSFELVYGTNGPMAEVPLRIKYRPKWWLEAELVLDDEGTF